MARARIALALCVIGGLDFLLVGGAWAQPARHGTLKIGAPIADLLHAENEPQVTCSDPNNEGRVTTILPGTFKREGWKLSTKGQDIQLDEEGKFGLLVPLQGAETTVDLVATGPAGETESGSWVFSYPDYDACLVSGPFQDAPVEEVAEAPKKKKKKRGMAKMKFTPNIGVSLNSYLEDPSDSLSYFTANVRVVSSWAFKPPRWAMASEIYFDAMPFAANPSGVAMRRLQISVRVGYSIPFIKSPWRMELMAGATYANLLVSGASLGYTFVFHPQYYPTLRFALNKRNSIGVYARYVPVTPRFSFWSSTEREIAAGIAYVRILGNKHPLVVRADFTDLRMVFDGVATRQVSYGLSLGYGL